MRIEFNEKEHKYFVNGEIAGISVTELLAKHKLAPNYSSASKSRLKESADKGKEVHKDLENILNKAEYEPTTEQGRQYLEWVKKNLDCGVGEQMLAYDKDGMIIAGTADVMGILKDGSLLLADHKNTSQFQREYVSWQVSLLDYFARQLHGEPVNSKMIKWNGASRFICFHYDPKTGGMQDIELEKVSDEEIERLIECEYNGEIYQRPNLVVDPELEKRFLQAEQQLAELERAKIQIETVAKECREKLCELFEQQKLTYWKSPNELISVTYVSPSEKITVDSKKLKEKYPQVYAECQKLSKTKAYVRVKLGEEE